MPTDGTLFLENLPYSKQYLLTLLSVFFSLGAVLSSTVSYLFLPGASCRQFDGCDIAGKENDGWRRVLFVLGLFVSPHLLSSHQTQEPALQTNSKNLTCSLMRWFLFRLQESPRYLVSRGRQTEAVVALQAIATYNDADMDISHADVHADFDNHQGHHDGEERDKKNSELPTPEYGGEGERSPLPFSNGGSPIFADRSTSATSYNSVGIGPTPPPRKTPLRLGSAFYTQSPGRALDEPEQNAFEASFASTRPQRDSEEEMGEFLQEHDEEEDDDPISRKTWSKWQAPDVQSWWRSWVMQISRLFVPQWRRTVILMWIIWGSMSFGTSGLILLLHVLWPCHQSADLDSIYNVQRVAAGST